MQEAQCATLLQIKIKPATIRLRANSFMHDLEVLAGDLIEGGRVDTECGEVVGARAATCFDSSADGVCSPKDGECAAKEASTD
jgi:hypothetical protein